MRGLEKKFMMGEEKYPISLMQAYNMMLNWKSIERGKVRTHTVNLEGHMIFLHHEDDEEEQGGRPPKNLSKI